MEKPQYIYELDEHPPLRHALLYALQWAIIVFPSLIIVATLSVKALNASVLEGVRFFQLVLLTSGIFTAVQSLWGHRYPLLDGPATALLLTYIVVAPFGLPAIQGGTIVGGTLLIAIVLLGKLKKVMAYTTPNVVGVILMLIAFTLLPHLTRSMTGMGAAHPGGSLPVFLTCIGLVLFMATLAYRLKGFIRTLSLLMGMVIGTLLFSISQAPDLAPLAEADWVSLPSGLIPSAPALHWPSVLAFAASYVAVLVNSLGSLNGIASVTDPERLPTSISRGVLINGFSGICCGMLGIVGMVSYSLSPGVVLANRVASRYATFYCGVLLIVAAFVPKLAALLSLVPAPVVGAALCAAMGTQIGAALSIISAAGLGARDYFVVGIPVLLGTLIGFLPEPFISSVSPTLRVFVGNGLIAGIIIVLILEHLLLRKQSS